MKHSMRFLVSLAVLSAAVASQAVLDLQITLPASKTIASGGTLFGTVTGATGKVSLTLPNGYNYTGGSFTFDAGFLSYIASNTGGDYSGNIATATNLGTTTALGSLSVSDSISSDSENFAVNPVPEPSAFAALGLGAAAFLRRRRKA